MIKYKNEYAFIFVTYIISTLYTSSHILCLDLFSDHSNVPSSLPFLLSIPHSTLPFFFIFHCLVIYLLTLSLSQKIFFLKKKHPLNILSSFPSPTIKKTSQTTSPKPNQQQHKNTLSLFCNFISLKHPSTL